MSPFLHNFKEFQPKHSLFKTNFPKTDVNLFPKCQSLWVFVKNIPRAVAGVHLIAELCSLNLLWPSDAYMRRWSVIVSDNGLSSPNHYLNQCWNIINWTRRYKHQWNLIEMDTFFLQENAFWKCRLQMAAILSRRQCVKKCPILTWYRTVEKTLTEPMVIQFCDAYSHQSASMSFNSFGPQFVTSNAS